MMRIELTRDWSAFHKGGDVRLTIGKHWFRLAAYFGEAPGTHMGLWRTRTGTVTGWNYRAGTLRRNLTVLAHKR